MAAAGSTHNTPFEGERSPGRIEERSRAVRARPCAVSSAGWSLLRRGRSRGGGSGRGVRQRGSGRLGQVDLYLGLGENLRLQSLHFLALEVGEDVRLHLLQRDGLALAAVREFDHMETKLAPHRLADVTFLHR